MDNTRGPKNAPPRRRASGLPPRPPAVQSSQPLPPAPPSSVPDPIEPPDVATTPGVDGFAPSFSQADDTAEIEVFRTTLTDAPSFGITTDPAAEPLRVQRAAPAAPAPAPGKPASLAPVPFVRPTAPVVRIPGQPDPQQPAPLRISEPPVAPVLSPISGVSIPPPPMTLHKGPWPFVPLAPLAVVLVGMAVALGIGCVGIDHLARAGDEQAGARADLLAATVAARLSQLPPERRLEATQVARRKSDAELLVVTDDAKVVYDMTLGAPDRGALEQMLSAGQGVVKIRYGRARFAVRPLGQHERVVVWVAEPASAERVPRLTTALLALATLLLGVAGAVAQAVARDVTRDVEFVTHRVRGMSQVRAEPTGELIPARTMDEVGFLTVAFNKLVGRFGKAERAYREDLARANAADRERAAFLAAVSHELRSPLNAILGFADILMEEVDGPLSASAKEEVEQIRGSGAHLLALINDILEFSALESGQLKLSRAKVDLGALANEVVKEARGLIGQKPLVVRVDEEAAVIARCDGRRVRQILGNLVNNAIKFTQQGEVVVKISRAGSGKLAKISVSDTGPGISSAERAMIFQEYKQARGERQRRRGTGLGLAIARRLVLLHNGSIQVESELGRGSTFEVMLPIGNIEAAPSIAPPMRGRDGEIVGGIP